MLLSVEKVKSLLGRNLEPIISVTSSISFLVALVVIKTLQSVLLHYLPLPRPNITSDLAHP